MKLIPRSYFLYLALLSIALQSCRPDPLEIELPRYDPQVVVFSQIIPNQVMTVLLTQTIDALDFSDEEGDSVSQNLVDQLLLSNAKMTVSYRNQEDSLFQVSNGLYASITTPQYPNEEYTLKGTLPDGRVIRASSVMLPFVPFLELDPVIERDVEDTLVTVNYKFEDPTGDNWYMINVYTNGEEVNTGTDLNTLFNSGSNLLKRTVLLSDQLSTGTILEGSIDLPNISPTDSMVVSLSNINETYFDFLTLRQNSTNFFTELTKEPVSLPTNVEGGLGFFNTHSPDLRYFDLNDF